MIKGNGRFLYSIVASCPSKFKRGGGQYAELPIPHSGNLNRVNQDLLMSSVANCVVKSVCLLMELKGGGVCM